MLREIANRRIADQIEQADKAIARGDFDAGLAAVNVLKASAPPEWSGAIAKVDERGRRAREEALARERQRREEQSRRAPPTYDVYSKTMTWKTPRRNWPRPGTDSRS